MYFYKTIYKKTQKSKPEFHNEHSGAIIENIEIIRSQMGVQIGISRKGNILVQCFQVTPRVLNTTAVVFVVNLWRAWFQQMQVFHSLYESKILKSNKYDLHVTRHDNIKHWVCGEQGRHWIKASSLHGF